METVFLIFFSILYDMKMIAFEWYNFSIYLFHSTHLREKGLGQLRPYSESHPVLSLILISKTFELFILIIVPKVFLLISKFTFTVVTKQNKK